MTPLPRRIVVAFACVYFFWGSTYVAMRYGVAVLSPWMLGAARYCISGPLMLAICAARGLPLRQTPRTFGILAVIGLLMLSGGNMGVLWAEQYLSSGLAALLVASIPLYVALFEAVLPGGEALRARGWLGIAVGFAGLVVLLSPGLRVGAGEHQLTAALVALGAAFAWSVASLIARRARLPTPPFVAAAWQMIFAGLFNLLTLVAVGGAHGFGALLGRQAALSIAWLVVFGSLVGYTAYIYLLENVPVAKVSTYAYINPVVAVALGALILGERLNGVEYIGMAAILIAVYLVTSSQLKRTAEA